MKYLPLLPLHIFKNRKVAKLTSLQKSSSDDNTPLLPSKPSPNIKAYVAALNHDCEAGTAGLTSSSRCPNHPHVHDELSRRRRGLNGKKALAIFVTVIVMVIIVRMLFIVGLGAGLRWWPYEGTG